MTPDPILLLRLAKQIGTAQDRLVGQEPETHLTPSLEDRLSTPWCFSDDLEQSTSILLDEPSAELSGGPLAGVPVTLGEVMRQLGEPIPAMVKAAPGASVSASDRG